MKWNCLVVTAALAVCQAAAASDHIYYAGAIPLAPDLLLYRSLHDPEHFVDTLVFELKPEDVGGGGIDLSIDSTLVRHVDYLAYTLWSGNTLLGAFGEGGHWMQHLDAGEYRLRVGGEVNDADGGYWGIQMQLLPAPEPGTWAMLAAGLPLVLAARRRGRRMHG
jgi:hypothetical protein